MESQRRGGAHGSGRCPAAPGTIALLASIACAALLGPGVGFAQQAGSAPSEAAASTIPPDQLDSLVAPIALYPDSLLAQVLVASTYPLELVQLQQWLEKNPTLKDEALAEAAAQQPWDTSVQSMAAFPDVVKWLVDDVQWTTDLGNAFLAQQSDVMDAVQRMRKKAQDNGALASNEQQKVETQVVENKTVIVVESADPEVIYVPSYSPTVVYGPPVYPYPAIYYPPYTPGAAFVSFSFGVMMGAAFWGGSCCRCGWGHNDIKINVENNFNRIDRDRGGRGDGNWSHNPRHRGGTPYGDRATANRFGGSARGDSLSSRQASARQQIARQQPSARTRPSAAPGGSRPAAGAGRAPAPRAGGRPAGGSDRIGSRQIPKSSASHQGGFGGGSRGYSGASARASSTRGARSVGGMSRGRPGGVRRR